MRVALLVAMASADYVDEINRLGKLHHRGMLSDDEYTQLKATALERHMAERKDTTSKRRSLAEDSKVGACLTDFINDKAGAPGSDCLDAIKESDAPAVKILFDYLQKKSGNAENVIPFVKKNADLLAAHSNSIEATTKQIASLNRAMYGVLKTIYPTGGDCQVVGSRRSTRGSSNGAMQNPTYHSWFSNADATGEWARSVVDGDMLTGGYGRNQVYMIKTKGMCDACVKVWTSAENYHNAFWSVNGSEWVGLSMGNWQKCYGTSCGQNPNTKGKGSFWHPVFAPYKDLEQKNKDKSRKWQYFAYSEYNHPRRVWEIEVVGCPNAGSKESSKK